MPEGSRGSNLDAVLSDFNGDGNLDLFLTDVNYVRSNVYAWGKGEGGLAP